MLQNSTEMTPTQVFFCKFCKILLNTFFIKHLWTTASEIFSKKLIHLCKTPLMNNGVPVLVYVHWAVKNSSQGENVLGYAYVKSRSSIKPGNITLNINSNVLLLWRNEMIIQETEAVPRKYYVKKLFLKVLQNSLEDTCAKICFL